MPGTCEQQGSCNLLLFYVYSIIDRLDENVFEQISFFSLIAFGQPESHEMYCKLKMLEVKIFQGILQVLSFYRSYSTIIKSSIFI